MNKNRYPAKIILAITLGLLCNAAQARNPIANDWDGYYGPGGTSGVESNSMAIMESSTGAKCQVCHVESGGGSPWNAYGWAVRQAVSGSDWVGAFMAIENHGFRRQR